MAIMLTQKMVIKIILVVSLVNSMLTLNQILNIVVKHVQTFKTEKYNQKENNVFHNVVKL